MDREGAPGPMPWHLPHTLHPVRLLPHPPWIMPVASFAGCLQRAVWSGPMRCWLAPVWVGCGHFQPPIQTRGCSRALMFCWRHQQTKVMSGHQPVIVIPYHWFRLTRSHVPKPRKEGSAP
jgi:hypothetical protein